MLRDVPPIKDISKLAAPGIFRDDVELDEFLKWVRAERNADLD